MRDSLWDFILSWWRSGRAHDATGTGALLRSPAVRAAAADLPQINRCRSCPAFVQKAGAACFRCDPAQLDRERQDREARVRREASVARFRSRRRG